jgi:hypothetical protein
MSYGIPFNVCPESPSEKPPIGRRLRASLHCAHSVHRMPEPTANGIAGHTLHADAQKAHAMLARLVELSQPSCAIR